MTGPRLYPWAEAMRAELAAVPWIPNERHGVAPRRDVGELAAVVARHRAELRTIVATHPDPHVRRIYRDMRGDFAELIRQLRLPSTHARNAFIGTLCNRLTALGYCAMLDPETLTP